MTTLRLPLACLLVVLWLSSARAAEPKKLAFLVGIDKYHKDGLSHLHYAGADAEALAEALKKGGFSTDLLLREEATRDAIKKRFDAFISKTKKCGKEDIVLVSFAGHGREMDLKRGERRVTEPFFCPYDTNINEPETMFSLNEVMQALVVHSGSSQNLMLIDACRDDPNRGGRGLDGGTVKELPAKLSVLFACSHGQRSFESDKARHGVFTAVLLDGLNGGARDENGEVAWLDLANYAMKNVKRRLPDLMDGADIVQQPNLFGNLSLIPALIGPGAAGAQVTNSIGMKLTLIPAGEFMMGSPDSEEGWSKDEGPRHRVRITKPFYLGVYEVTQAEYERVMGENPSYFSSGGDGASSVSGLNTGRFPVESVSWEDAVAFCGKLSDFAGERAAGRRYRLPTEAEWEYACREGATTPFSFGSQLNGREANCAGNYPYGTTEKGPLLERTTTVGSYRANAFGLFDMHGNALEWCADWYDSDYYATSPVNDPPGSAAGSFRVI
ncbi:MAG TPA: SUMF1/EgtB/PvdO family nonheme iron enzyme, partial [Pirellulales bacterium]